MFITPSFKKSLIVEQFQGNYLKSPDLATPNEVDRVMKDWWRMKSLQEYLKALCFYFACLTTALLRQPLFLFSFAEENSSPLLKQQLPELEGFCDSWLDVTTHSETQTLFCTASRSISLGVTEAGTLELDLSALKSQNPIFFFLEYLLTHYRATRTIKTLLVVWYNFTTIYTHHSSLDFWKRF